jgi:2-oxoglutarate dehydrogenase E1 component
VPLNHISEQQAKLEVINSSLSEFSCLGFEYGYSLADPNTLVMWEAQFGDFANNAQVMFDQFLTSSEFKWHRLSGLVILLPHGYEGQGPEHSSARLERFLQACAADNIQVCNCTTAGQYFHLLRRQILRSFRKPLIIMSPKSMLRLPDASSNISEITEGAFKKVIFDSELVSKDIKKVVFCSGKVYYDIKKGLEDSDKKDIALVRVEQLYPFPAVELEYVLNHFSNAKKYVWAQEEPRNQGAWLFIRDRLEPLLPKSLRLEYVGRNESPSPAAGHMKVHIKEHEKLVSDAIA